MLVLNWLELSRKNSVMEMKCKLMTFFVGMLQGNALELWLSLALGIGRVLECYGL